MTKIEIRQRTTVLVSEREKEEEEKERRLDTKEGFVSETPEVTYA